MNEKLNSHHQKLFNFPPSDHYSPRCHNSLTLWEKFGTGKDASWSSSLHKTVASYIHELKVTACGKFH
jgi:hypothetical protein